MVVPTTTTTHQPNRHYTHQPNHKPVKRTVIPSTATPRTPPHALTPHAHTSQHYPTTHRTHTHTTRTHTTALPNHTQQHPTARYTIPQTVTDRPLYHTCQPHPDRPLYHTHTQHTHTPTHTHTTHAHTAHHCPTLYVPTNRTHTARSTILPSPAYNIRDSTGCQLFVVGRGGVGCHDTIPCTMKPVAGQPPAEPRGTPAAGPSRAATPGAHTTTSAAGATPTPPDTAAPSIYGQWCMRALTQQGPAAPGHTIRPSK